MATIYPFTRFLRPHKATSPASGGFLMPARTDRDAFVADKLYERLIARHETFWSVVYPLFMAREITRATLRNVVQRGLEDARGNYQQVVSNFNMPPQDYQRFLNFLRKYDCQIQFQA